jgi:hypothetical protein
MSCDATLEDPPKNTFQRNQIVLDIFQTYNHANLIIMDSIIWNYAYSKKYDHQKEN